MPDSDERVQYRGTGFYVGLVAILLFAVVLLVLAVQNTQEVDVAFFGLEFTVPLFAVAIGAAILAVVLDELIGLVWRRRRRTRLEDRAELDHLRAANAPAAEEPGEPADAEVERTEDQADPPWGNTPTP
jgi:uncharacterized integral membrane protein